MPCCGCAIGPSISYDVEIKNVKNKEPVTCVECVSLNGIYILERKLDDCTWYKDFASICGFVRVRLRISDAAASVFLDGGAAYYMWGPLPFPNDDCTAPLTINGYDSNINCAFDSSSVRIVAS